MGSLLLYSLFVTSLIPAELIADFGTLKIRLADDPCSMSLIVMTLDMVCNLGVLPSLWLILFMSEPL